MKKQIQTLFMIAALAIATPASAQYTAGPFEITGDVVFGATVQTGKPPLDDASDSTPKKIQSLTQTAKTDTVVVPIIGLDLSLLHPESETMITLSTMGDYALSLDKGLGDMGVLTLGAGYFINEVWKDPYLTGTKRSRTDMEILSFGVGLDTIMQFPLAIHYDLETVSVDKDIAGDTNALLKRDGKIHTLDLSYLFFEGFSHNILISMHASKGEIEGKSNAFQGGGMTLSHLYGGGAWDIQTGIHYGKKDFDKKHPKFGKVRQEKSYGIEASFRYHNPWGFENWFVGVMASAEKIDANIDFYDATLYSAGTMAGYQF